MAKDQVSSAEEKALDPCGIIMPIASFGEYDAQHWNEVRVILERAITRSKFRPAPVWERSETDIIQGRIVRNLYDYEVVVCDISGLNPNVMFELGLRLAFKKPVVIVVDDETKIPFDTNVIEHIIYNRGLHFQKTEAFIDRVSDKITNIVQMCQGGSYVAYIDALGAFSTFEPNPQKVEFDQFVLDKLEQISANISRLRRDQDWSRSLLNSIRHQAPNALAAFGSASDYAEPTGWSEDRQALLIDLWEKGETASTIADALGGVTRNAVIGKAHRLGLKSRPGPDSD